ncbi:TIGR02391 family protein [Knoellia sp. S7-12]|uniref:TIGR02391 family protein n=1 Tax=Knoellia sp. S7-12 TaxID=3126698 RepID=UPI00336744AA
MKPERAIAALEDLKREASSPGVQRGEDLTAWQGKVRGVFVSALGRDDHLVDRFDQVGYSPGLWTDNTPHSVFIESQRDGIKEACGVIDAVLYQLRLRTEDEEEPVDARAYDPELWEHVRGLVEAKDWGKVASQTAIFVEDRLRSWAGDPRNGRGESLVGKELMGRVFSDDSDWRLGSRAAEREGWRALGTGFAAALSNVDRHRIQKREDARRYAIGVLGLGSLLLTQMRFEHGELIEDLQTGLESADSS